ncbi:MAG: phosphomannomutase/phosphoglucomutase [Syntrophobacterales bacterium]|nr:phosphomannomutase/phosphoglucomutase [Syntrophobacterales bacterium]
MNPAVFREYDVRGLVGVDLDEEFVYLLGKAIGSYAARAGVKKMALGRDCRLSSESYLSQVGKGIMSAGIAVIDIGLCATPILYFAIRHLRTEGGVMVTGSHNPPDFNGFKICIGPDTIYGEQIQELRKIMEAGDYVNGAGQYNRQDIAEAYENYLFEHVTIKPGKKIVLDAGNGVGGIFALPLLKRYGCQVTDLYCDPNGRFPNHFPDPTVPENLQELVRRVLGEKADLGIAYDGDADRIGVVTDQGKVLWGDELLLLFARFILKDNPGAAIIGEVKCSQKLYDDIANHGGRAIMWKAGHSLIKGKMKEENALLAGEMSGHIFFADRYFGFDDAIYASLRLLEILSQTEQKLSTLLSDVPESFSTPEIRRDCPDHRKFGIVESIRNYYKEGHDIVAIDGVRVNFSDGWGLIRASNTQPVLVLRFEAQTQPRLEAIRKGMESVLEKALNQDKTF